MDEKMFESRFCALLKERNVTALTVAKEIGVPKSIVYEWKSGVREPTMQNLRRLSDYFGVSVAWLIGQENDEPDAGEKDLILLLREAKKISPEEHDELVEGFRRNLGLYLRAKGKND